METYEEVLAHLARLELFGMKLGLDNISLLLKELGNPEKDFKSVHVAGTNGKGSVTAFTASILQASGFRVGMYTSPHLSSFRERIMVNGQLIGKEELVEVFNIVSEKVEKIRHNANITYFEFVTAMSFVFFSNSKVDFAVIEVGLGGRLDATNVINPEVAAITHIALEHTEHLGNDLVSIAAEKAGIIKPGITVVTAERNSAVLQLFRKACKDMNAGLTVLDEAVSYGIVKSGIEMLELDVHAQGQDFLFIAKCINNGTFDMHFAISTQIKHNLIGPNCARRTIWESRDNVPKLKRFTIRLKMLGRHQARNAMLAFCIGTILAKRHASITFESIRQGLEKTVWPGRLEVVSRKPLVVLDGAHNPDGMRALADFCRESIGKRVILVLGVSNDKDIESICRNLDFASKLILTRAKYRGADPQKLASFFPGKEFVVMDEVVSAVKAALIEANEFDAVIITGSLFVIGEARKVWGCETD